MIEALGYGGGRSVKWLGFRDPVLGVLVGGSRGSVATYDWAHSTNFHLGHAILG